MSAKALRGLVAAAALLAGQCLSSSAYADPAISVETYPMFGPQARSDGAQWCGRDYNGYYGSTIYFAQAQVWVNYGGVCNAQWPQPAGKIQVRAYAYQGSSLIEMSSWASNGSNSYQAQANVSRYSSATMYGAVAKFFDPNGTFIGFSRDRT